MARANLRVWALKGAEQRLVEIAAEAARIYAEFPELRDPRDGSSAAVTSSTGDKPRRGNRRSLAARRRMAEAQRKRWAAVRAEKAAAAQPASSRQARKKR